MDEDHMEDHEEDVYGDDARESMTSDDEISPEEEAFMKGYDEATESDDDDDDASYEKSFEK